MAIKGGENTADNSPGATDADIIFMYSLHLR